MTILLSVLRSIYWNFRIFPFAIARHLPLLIHYRYRVNVTRGSIQITNPHLKFAMLKVGLFGAEEIPVQGIGSLIIKNGGELVVTGPMLIAAGSSVIIDHGHLTVGASFWMNRNGLLSISHNSRIGAENIFGWNVSLVDGNGHHIQYRDQQFPKKGIQLGQHNWLAAQVSVLSGAQLGDHNVVSYGSLLTSKPYAHRSYQLYGGMPAHPIRTIVTWHD